MYIPEIIMLVIIAALAFYSSHINQKHTKELEEQKERLEKEHLDYLRRHTDAIESNYEKKISELDTLICKLKEGTMVDELNAEIEALKQEVYKLEDCNYELSHKEETDIVECFNLSHANLSLIHSILSSINVKPTLERCIVINSTLSSLGWTHLEESDSLIEEIKQIIEWEEE